VNSNCRRNSAAQPGWQTTCGLCASQRDVTMLITSLRCRCKLVIRRYPGSPGSISQSADEDESSPFYLFQTHVPALQCWISTPLDVSVDARLMVNNSSSLRVSHREQMMMSSAVRGAVSGASMTSVAAVHRGSSLM